MPRNRCVLYDIINETDPNALKVKLRSMFNTLGMKNVIIVSVNRPVPYIFKSIIEDEFYLLINFRNFAKANKKQRLKQLVRELNKIFYGVYKRFNLIENVYQFLKMFGISVVVFDQFQKMALAGKFGKKLQGRVGPLFVGMLATVIFNTIYDNTIEKLLNSAKAKVVLAKFYSKINCNYKSLMVETYMPEIDDRINESVIRNVRAYIIGRIRTLLVNFCGGLRSIYRLFIKIFGFETKYVKKLYEVLTECNS